MIEPIFYPHIFDQQLYKIYDKNQLEENDINIVIKVDKVTTLPDEPAPTLEMDRSTKELSDKCSKNIWLFVQPENNESISAQEFDMVIKTLGALKLQIDDVAIFVPGELLHTYFKQLDFLDKKIINFGVSTINFVKEKPTINELIKIKSVIYLYTATLKQLQENITLKKEWWNKMKLIFE